MTSTSFTCITCRIAVQDAELQRAHYKTDWHRYNLKRKVAELPSITAEEFQRRVLQQRKNDENKSGNVGKYCEICKKNFGNSKAYDNHLNSKRHKTNETNYNSVEVTLKRQTSSDTKESTQGSMVIDEDCFVESDIEEVDSDEWEEDVANPIDNNDCLFCSHHSRNLLKNLKHMTEAHSFFVPDVEYCSDIQGLLHYLGEKINEGFMCIWCNDKGRTFHTAEAAKNHMLDKGHCKMLHEGFALAEYTDFYDYSASYPDANDANVNADEEVEVDALDGSDYQLVLPSGAVVGHRSLMRYYKQSIDPNRIVPSKNTKKLHKVLSEYKALGWTATQQEAAARKARDIHYLKRLHSKYTMKLGLKANKLQKHFRPQVNF